MKTYLLEVINRIKRFSEKFDVSTTLCNKTWVVFNDSGERELYIFQPDGSVIITNNGIGIKGRWEWISANNSLLIIRDDNVVMLHPEFIDSTILALTLDGTQKMAFLIEQANKEAFEAKTLTQLDKYFKKKEKLLIEAEERSRKEKEERERKEKEERERKEREERERKKKEERERKEKEDRERKEKEIKQLKEDAEKIAADLKPKWYSFLESMSAIIGLGSGGVIGGVAAWQVLQFFIKHAPNMTTGDTGNVITDTLEFLIELVLMIGYIIIEYGLPLAILIGFALCGMGFFMSIITTPFKPLAKKKFNENLEEWHYENPTDKRYPFIEFESSSEQDSK